MLKLMRTRPKRTGCKSLNHGAQKIMIDVIQRAKIKLIENNVSPPYLIYLSLSTHDLLVDELLVDEINKGDRRKNIRILEIGDMKVEIDPLCPSWGAYITGEESNR